jgi:hypothetical protein
MVAKLMIDDDDNVSVIHISDEEADPIRGGRPDPGYHPTGRGGPNDRNNDGILDVWDVNGDGIPDHIVPPGPFPQDDWVQVPSRTRPPKRRPADEDDLPTPDDGDEEMEDEDPLPGSDPSTWSPTKIGGDEDDDDIIVTPGLPSRGDEIDPTEEDLPGGGVGDDRPNSQPSKGEEADLSDGDIVDFFVYNVTPATAKCLVALDTDNPDQFNIIVKVSDGVEGVGGQWGHGAGAQVTNVMRILGEHVDGVYGYHGPLEKGYANVSKSAAAVVSAAARFGFEDEAFLIVDSNDIPAKTLENLPSSLKLVLRGSGPSLSRPVGRIVEKEGDLAMIASKGAVMLMGYRGLSADDYDHAIVMDCTSKQSIMKAIKKLGDEGEVA